MCHVSCVTCHVSRVTCHVSPVMCHLSHVTCRMSKYIYIFLLLKRRRKEMDPEKINGQSGGASWWRVCYQRDQPRLVFISTIFNLTEAYTARVSYAGGYHV